MHLEFSPLLEQPRGISVSQFQIPKPLTGVPRSFATLCHDLLRDERRLQDTLQKLSRRRVLEPEKLLELQTLVYSNMQRVEIVSRCVQSVQSTLHHLRQGQ